MIPVIVTIVMFLMIAPKSRTFILESISQAADWAVAWAPLSYVIILVILMAPLVSWYVISSGPKVTAPEDPLARYKNADDVLPD